MKLNGKDILIFLKGAKGVQGVQGEKGEKGDKGEQGIQGEKGEQGNKGNDGVGIYHIQTGETEERNGYTITNIDIIKTDNSTQSIQVIAKNGADGSGSGSSGGGADGVKIITISDPIQDEQKAEIWNNIEAIFYGKAFIYQSVEICGFFLNQMKAVSETQVKYYCVVHHAEGELFAQMTGMVGLYEFGVVVDISTGEITNYSSQILT